MALVMRVTVVGRVLSVQISEMSGVRFGSISIQSNKGTRYDLKFDKESKGDTPKIKDTVTVCFEGDSIKRIIWIQKGTATSLVEEAKRHEANDELEDALLAYEKAIEINPTYTSAWYHKAKLHHRLEQQDQFDECYAMVKEQEPYSRMKDDLDRLLGLEIVVERTPDDTREILGPPQRGFEIRKRSEELHDFISKTLEHFTDQIFEDSIDFASQIVSLNEPTVAVQNYDLESGIKPGTKKLDQMVDVISSGVDMVKKRGYSGTVWVHQTFRRKTVDDIGYSILYQGVFVKKDILLFPNVIVSEILNHSIPHGLSLVNSYGAVSYIRSSEDDPQFHNLTPMKDAMLPTLFAESLSGYDAGIQSLKIAKTTETEILDLFTSIPYISHYKTKTGSRFFEYNTQGYPVLSLLPWMGKTILSLQFCPNMPRKQEAKSIVQTLETGRGTIELEIGLPNPDMFQSAILCIDKFRTMKEFPETEVTLSEPFALWSHVLIGLELARQLYLPDSEHLSLEEILTYTKRVSHLVYKIEHDLSILFELDRFKPMRGLYD